MGSVHLTEGVTASSTHIRFYTVTRVIKFLDLKINNCTPLTLPIFFHNQGKPKNMWSRWQSSTTLEKILVGACVLLSTLLVFALRNPTGAGKCSSVARLPPEANEETNFVGNAGQGKTIDVVSERYSRKTFMLSTVSSTKTTRCAPGVFL